LQIDFPSLSDSYKIWEFYNTPQFFKTVTFILLNDKTVKATGFRTRRKPTAIGRPSLCHRKEAHFPADGCSLRTQPRAHRFAMSSAERFCDAQPDEKSRTLPTHPPPESTKKCRYWVCNGKWN
jgi:hypothetical protein